MVKIALNGFGRIGRTLVRSLFRRTDTSSIALAAINVGPDDPARLAHLLKYDTTLGVWKEKISYHNGILFCGPAQIAIIQESDPAHCPWKEYEIDWVLEASGQFTDGQAARAHCASGAKKSSDLCSGYKC